MGKAIRDTTALVGLALVGVGLWLIHPPIAMVVVGCLLLTGAILGHYNAAE